MREAIARQGCCTFVKPPSVVLMFKSISSASETWGCVSVSAQNVYIQQGLYFDNPCGGGQHESGEPDLFICTQLCSLLDQVVQPPMMPVL